MTDIQSMQLHQSSPRSRPRSKAQGQSKIDYRGITLRQYFRLYDESIDHSTIQEIKEEPAHSETSSAVQTPSFGSNPHQKRDNHPSKLKKLKTETSENPYNNEEDEDEIGVGGYCAPNRPTPMNVSFDQVHLIQSQSNNKKHTQYNPNKQLNKKNSYNSSSIEKLNTSLMKKVSCVKKSHNTVNQNPNNSNHNHSHNPNKRTPQQKVKTLGVEQTDRSTLTGFYKPNGKNVNANNHIEKRNRMLKKIQADRDRSQEIKQQDIFYITKYANKFKIDTKQLLMD